MDTPKRAVLIAQRRSGSTMLCYALSNHPEVHCNRGEPLQRKSAYRWALGGAASPWGSEVYKRIIGLALRQWGYETCVVKVNWGPGTEDVWKWLGELHPPIRGIYLSRVNVLRQAVSELLRRRSKLLSAPRIHTHERLPPMTTAVTPATLLQLMADLETSHTVARDRLTLSGIPYLALTYRDLVGEEGVEVDYLPPAVSDRLCDWLEVRRIDRLSVEPLRRLNPYPLKRILENWSEVRHAIAASRWAHFLEDEARWN